MVIENPVIFSHNDRLAYIFSQKLGRFKGYGEKDKKNKSFNLINKIDNYKLYWTYLDEFDPKPLETGLDRVISQNYPSITFVNNKLQISFIGRQILKDVGIVNFLYQMEGSDIESLEPAVNTFVYSNVACKIGKNLAFFKKNKLHFHSSDFQAYSLNPFFIRSIVPVIEHEELVVLNGYYGKNKGSFLYDIKENVVVGKFIVGKKQVEYASLFKNKLYYLEDNKILESEDYSIEETDLFFSDPKKSNYDERFFSTLKFEQMELEDVHSLSVCSFIEQIGISSDCCVICSGGGCVTATCSGSITTTLYGTFVTSIIVGDYEYTFLLNGSPPPYSAAADEEVCLTVSVSGGPPTHYCYFTSCGETDCYPTAPLFVLSTDRSSIVYNPKQIRKKLKSLSN